MLVKTRFYNPWNMYLIRHSGVPLCLWCEINLGFSFYIIFNCSINFMVGHYMKATTCLD